MTKAELIDHVSEKTELKKRDVAEVVDTLLESITSSLQKGEKVALIPFGSFETRHRKAREARNPKTGAKLQIAAHNVAAFKPGKELRDAVRKSKKR